MAEDSAKSGKMFDQSNVKKAKMPHEKVYVVYLRIVCVLWVLCMYSIIYAKQVS